MVAELYLGNEAVALAALDAGVAGAFSYPGTPATEILECVQEHRDPKRCLAAEWSANEKSAYEEALGVSVAGRRALVSMKHVGLNVAADPFMSSALTGVRGGLVLAVADDPGMHSSQNEQDSRFYGAFARIPVFEPSNQQEAYDATREAFRASERFGVPVMVRLTTRLAHSRARVVRRAVEAIRPVERPLDWRDWTLLPVNARRRYQRLLDLQPMLHGYSEQSPFNRLSLAGPAGVIACGLAYNYVREALSGDSSHSLLKISTYPPPTGLIRELVDHCGSVLVVEEGYPLVESMLTGLLGLPGKTIRGKQTGDLPAAGELSVDAVRAALGTEATNAADCRGDLPARPPRLCDGCPHADTFRAILEATADAPGRILFGDIGCYTLGALPPHNAVHTCVDMGASISMAHGAARTGAHPVLCTIGDSTFVHSGMTALIGAARSDANMTVVILDNATVAMTGGQDVFVTGESLTRLLRGLGVREEHLVRIEPLPRHHARNVELLRREIRHRGLSVVVACRPCIQLKRRETERSAGAAANVG